MKRILSVLLLCSLLVALLLPFAAARETDEISVGTLERALAFALTDTSGALSGETAPKTQSANDGFLPKGLADDDNLILPGPLMTNRAVTPGARMTLPMILVQTGKTGQYRCTAIYYGDDLDAEPVGTNVEAFGTQEGMQECNLQWDTNGMKTGDYTIVCFTARQSGSQLTPVEGSASAERVYIQNYVPAAQKLSIVDWETGKAVKKLNLAAGDVGYLAVQSSPTPNRGVDGVTTYNTDLYVTNGIYGDYVCHEYNGLMIIEARSCGWGEIRVDDGRNLETLLDIEICADTQGHSIDEEYIVRAPEANTNGVKFLHCSRCGRLQRVNLPCYMVYFSKLVDVPESEWYYTYVRDAVGKNLFRGVSAHHFAPEETMTRAMLVTVLWRYEGEPQVGGTPFSDVRATDWYAAQIAWAAHNGVVNGTGNGKFDPEGMVTREQMAAVLYRYAQQKGFDTSARGDLSAFADSGAVSPWATEAMRWAVGSGLIGGSTSGGKLLLHPGDGATRAEVAAILVRFVDKIANPPVQPEPVDTTGAEASGQSDYPVDGKLMYWAFFPDGTLVIGGELGINNLNDYGSKPAWVPYADRVKTLKILNGVPYIGEYSFKNYPNLECVEIGQTVTTIGDGAFSGCAKLSEVILPESLRNLGYGVFMDCTSLAEIALPKNLYSVSGGLFQGCTSLKRVEIPDAVLDISRGEMFMDCTALESVKLPIGLQSIPNAMFCGCTALKQVEISSETYCIGYGAFYGCDAFEEIVLPPTVNTFSYRAFNGCANLKKITILSRQSLHYLDDDDYEDYEDRFQGGAWLFGDPEKVTVCGYAGSGAQELAERFGYKFEPITE